MTSEITPIEQIKPGIYHVLWRDGGASVAAVGMNRDGTRWLAPTNWVEPSTSTDWNAVSLMYECKAWSCSLPHFFQVKA
jgi:hypothetical protein